MELAPSRIRRFGWLTEVSSGRTKPASDDATAFREKSMYVLSVWVNDAGDPNSRPKHPIGTTALSQAKSLENVQGRRDSDR